MSNFERLRAALNRAKVYPIDVADVMAALELLGDEERMAGVLLGWAQSEACVYHAKKNVQAMERYYRGRGPDGPVTTAGGPQNDPGDVAGQQPLF